MRINIPIILTAVFMLFSLAPPGHAEAASRQQFSVQTPAGAVVVEHFAQDANTQRPAVIILSGSRGFTSPAYDEIGQVFGAAGLDAYLVHLLSPADLKAIANAGNASARIRYYAKRLPDWLASMQAVIADLGARPRHAGKVGVLGISLGAQTAAAVAASTGRSNIGALVLVDGGFPNDSPPPQHALPPLQLIWGSADRVFPLSTGQKLLQTAQTLGGTASLEVYPGGAHDFFLLPGNAEAQAARQSAAAFLARQLGR